MRHQLSPPSEWPAFETLCWGLWKVIWCNDNAQKNGRNGHPQQGVDIFGQTAKGCWAGVQCKGKENFTNQKLSKNEVMAEVKKAMRFRPKLSEYIIATTAPRNHKIQEVARNLTERHQKAGLFSVTVYGWEDIQERLYEYKPLIASDFYPDVFGSSESHVLLRLLSATAPGRSSSLSILAETLIVPVLKSLLSLSLESSSSGIAG